MGNDGKWRFSTQGAALYSGNDTSTNTQIQALDNELKTVNNTILKVSKLIGSENYSSVSGKHNTTHNTTTTTKNDTPQPVSGSLGDMEKQLQKLQSDLKNGFIPKEAEKQTIDSITKLKEKIEKEK